MNFIFFLIVNALLFLRPSELIPELQLPLYQIAILLCLAFSINPLAQFFTASPLRSHATVRMIYAMAVIAFASLIFNNALGDALGEFFDLAKLIVYFILFLALVTSPQRLRALCAVVTLCVMVTSTIGVLHYTGYISLPKLEVHEMYSANPDSNEHETIRRLRFTGMLQDPNEVAVVLSVLVFLCAYQWGDRRYGFGRHLWLVPLGTFLVAIAFTMSRGGLLALLAGVGVFAIYRYPVVHMAPSPSGAQVPVYKLGGGKALGFFLGMFLLMLVAFSGRQSNFDLKGSTGSGRIDLWSDWLMEFRGHPILGVSPMVSSTMVEGEVIVSGTNVRTAQITHLAHNSYIQAFADLGFVGGACFFGAFFWAFLTLHRYSSGSAVILDSEQKRFHPYLIAAVSCYIVGMMTLSINYLVATVFVLGLPLAFSGMTPCYPPISCPRLDGRGLWISLVAAVTFFASIYVFVRVFRSF